MDEEGHLSVEFIITILVMILMGMGMVDIVSERMDLAYEAEKLSEARFLAEKVASNINKVNSAGNGHEIKITLPEKVGKSSYLLWVNSSGVYVEQGGRKGKAVIYPVNIWFNASYGPGYRMMPGKTYRLLNKMNNGKTVIYIINVK
ncbi:MAG: hypothetical protein KKF16_07305 [Euryarchaeota archaeon]|nr:hypothetical protein [Euryarchaeota archaeon]MBU4608439.1 hypothetical protein [Euryarchaeota archaeon]MBV1729978.1 hypothetical protein [Methanobacterium sp.]MBV1755561.1 hypothetical protein [Methanobacterium sp.]